MNTGLEFLINKIIEKDLVLGNLAKEALLSANSNMFLAALSCLFILAEQSVKLASDETEGNFYKQIESLKKEKLLSNKDIKILHSAREIRNKLFHENHYMWALININNKASLFSESDSQEEIWRLLSKNILKITLKILSIK